MPNLQILPECFADTALMLLFVADRLAVVHIFGIPNVAKEMQEAAGRENTGLRIGLVDNDKRVPPYLLTFDIVAVRDKVILKRKGQTEQYLIVIDKAIESFLLWNAEQVGINVANYGFSTNVKLFGKALKTSAIGSDANYLQLLNDLYAHQAPGFQTLERILNDLITT